MSINCGCPTKIHFCDFRLVGTGGNKCLGTASWGIMVICKDYPYYLYPTLHAGLFICSHICTACYMHTNFSEFLQVNTQYFVKPIER